MRNRPDRHWPLAFTIVEVMIVILLIALLIAIAVPAFHRAQAHAQRVACRQNLHNIHIGLSNYATANGGILPTYVPGGENLYPWAPGGALPVTVREDRSGNWIGSRGNTQTARDQGRVPWGLGKLHGQLSEDLRVLFCPADGRRDAEAHRQAFLNDRALDNGDTPDCSYIYRGRDAPDQVETGAIRHFASRDDTVRALVMDYYVEWWGCPNPAHGNVRKYRPGNCPEPGCTQTLRKVRAWPGHHGDRICVLFEDGSTIDVRVLSPDGVTLRLVDLRLGPAPLNLLWRTADTLYDNDD